ncbi:MAG: hypothetical protein SCK29_05905 [Bacillota bacterium]|nr:hypothetical protein [Bacillota bacterium]MDW7683640.1 hypothetical protein [Bacillota bacterium]
MFDKICTKLCLHTRAARIAFFSSLFFILSITVIGAFYLYEPQTMLPPPAVQAFSGETLKGELYREFGPETGANLFSLVVETAEEGDRILQEYHFLRRSNTRTSTLTAEEARAEVEALQSVWTASAAPLLDADNRWIQAAAEDIEEGLSLAVTGLDRGTPFINQRLVKARGIFHDLNSVLLAEEKDDGYYGETRLGKLVEQELLP